MTVYCYPFTGTAWTESTASWSALTTQSWGAELDHQPISYANGQTKENVHRYEFNILDVVQAWIDGTADPTKGIIFKASDSVETGEIQESRVFGSFERESNKPIFEMTYTLDMTLNYSSKDVDEGNNFTLVASTSEGVLTNVTWVSQDTSIATVDSAGVVTGVNAGTTTIVATSPDANESVYCRVYVTLVDGVYCIRNADSGLCFVNADSAESTAATNITEKNTAETTKASEFWQITYAGSGLYIIRPMNRPLSVLTKDTDGNVIVQDLSAGATVQILHRWGIIHNAFGYAFMHRGLEASTMTPTDPDTDEANVATTSWASNLEGHWMLQFAKGVFLRDTTTQRTIPSSTVKYIKPGEMLSLADLGFSYEYSGGLMGNGLRWTTSNSAVATVDYSGAVTGVGAGQTTITLRAELDNVECSQSYILVCVKTVNVEVIYDEAYLYRYPDAVDRINEMMSELQDFYFTEFYVQVNYTVPQVFTSYADANCSSVPDEICDACEDAFCSYSQAHSDGTVQYSTYHHKGITNIALRIPFPDTSKTFKIAFIGHVVCDYNYYSSGCVNYDGEQHTFGVAYRELGLALVADSRSDQDELLSLVHEFGHLLGSIDHYADGCPSTKYANDNGYSTGVFLQFCIYGEERDDEGVETNKTICDGCRQLIIANINQIEHE